MPDNLSQLIDKVQSTLLDDGTLFSDAACTLGIRQALADVNIAAPQFAAATLAALPDQIEYELSDADPLATGILDVLLEGEYDSLIPLPYGAYVEDGRWFFRLHAARQTGDTLLVRYKLPHTLNGLDAAVETTLSEHLTATVLHGAVYYCCLLRSAATMESNNVEPNVSASWLKLASLWRITFDVSLDAARRAPAPFEQPLPVAWDDEWH